ncbi:MAG: hypothetical protein K6F73_08490 [Lachnospiraceae bacterium]|nr:hypothetical protein [Lachnospiraceae bacterium]
MNTGSAMVKSFYSELAEDYIRDGKKSVIYRYYYEEVFGPEKVTALSGRKATKKPVDTILMEHCLLGDRPKKKKLYDFTLKMLKELAAHHDLYDYPDRRLSTEGDMGKIADAISPFIKTHLPKSEIEKLSKAKLNVMLGDAIEELAADDACINKEKVDALVEHVRDRLIMKAFDDFLYNAGVRIEVTKTEDDPDERGASGQIVKSGEKGRAIAKNDKTLELITRYYVKTGRLPFAEMDFEDPAVRHMIEEFRDRLVMLRKKKPGNGRDGVSVVLAADRFTGITLQLIERCYFPFSVQKKIADRQFAFAVLERNAENGAYTYDAISSDANSVWIEPDLDEALIDYKSMVLTARDEIIENNCEIFDDDPDEIDRSVPFELKRFFTEEGEEIASELVEDTEEYIRCPYEDEEGDPEFIPNFQK